jgi:hypothetical protein
LPCAEQRHRLEEVRLAGAVVADQQHRAVVELQMRARIIAEVGQLEIGYVKALGPLAWRGARLVSPLRRSEEGCHTRIGIRT